MSLGGSLFSSAKFLFLRLLALACFSCLISASAYATITPTQGWCGSGTSNFYQGCEPWPPGTAPLYTASDSLSACKAEQQAVSPNFFQNATGPVTWTLQNFQGTDGQVGERERCIAQFLCGSMTCVYHGYAYFYSANVCPANSTLSNGACVCNTGYMDEESRVCVRPQSHAKNAGPSCPSCGNPINPGTGNKIAVETDYRTVADGQLSFVRYYNSGLQAVNNVLGGFWSHTFNTKIAANSAGTEATYTRADGRRYVFKLQSGAWVGEADVSDSLTEQKDSGGNRTGWQYRVADSDDTQVYSASGSLTSIQRRNGLTLTIVYSDGTNGSSTGNGGFVLDASGNATTAILPAGLLLRSVDQFGKQLTFGYDTYSRIVKITDPAGGAYVYAYASTSSTSNLLSVTYPGAHQRIYTYNESANTSGTNQPNALTGITDEKGFRFATYKYDTTGRATDSLHHTGSGDVDHFQVSYVTPVSQTTVTDPLGQARNYGFQNLLGVVKNNAVDQPTPGVPGASVTYDANGNLASRVDFNGNRTNYTYDTTRNLETARTEGLTSAGATTAQTRTITTEWHASFRLPKRIAEPLRITTYVYNGDSGASCGFKADNVTLVPGVLCSRSAQATTDANGSQAFTATTSGTARTVSYTYDKFGRVLTENGARTDVTDAVTLTYYAESASCPTSNGGHATGCRGMLESVTNALSQATQYGAYNARGQPLAITDANGVSTILAYDARQRLTSRAVGGETTGYEYDAVGQLTKVTLPDGSYLSYAYDGAHRLTTLEDNLGNKITYTLDAVGNRTAEQVRDPSNVLAQTRSRVFNSLNRLWKDIGAANQVTEYTYDDQGNVTSVKQQTSFATPPAYNTTSNQYDALNRLKQVSDPGTGVTQYAYNGLDALTQVTDPRSLSTGYTVDGLGNLTVQSSPDTGSTSSTYDTAGNLLTQTDAKSQVTTYAYDALNRVTLITFHDGSKQAYAYDLGTNGIGRLSSITETNSSDVQTSKIEFAYDAHGRVTSETRTLAGISYVVGYSYDSYGRMSGMTYPSGRTLTYAFDSLGRVNQLTTTKAGQSTVLVQNVQYHPFGGVKGFTLGNGQIYSRSIDQDGRIASYTLGATSYSLTFDAASRITGIGANTYEYDNLDRLTSAVLASSNFGYTYDAAGNRLTKVVGSNTDNYTYSTTSNRIATLTPAGASARSFTLDANGSTTNDSVNTYIYDTRGRMTQSVGAAGTTNYQLNALGQRVKKSTSTTETVFHYDARGRLVAESDATGTVKRELFYLGDIPVAVFQ